MKFITATGAVAVEVGTVFACALLETSDVRCWGNNELGQLGAVTEESSSFEPVAVAGIGNAIDLNSGDVHSCAALSTGEVACWGHNARGQLGVDADVGWSSEPILVDGITTATAVAAGGEHSCALLRDGEAQCWGSDEFDQS